MLRNGRDAGYALIRRNGTKTALYTRLVSMLNNKPITPVASVAPVTPVIPIEKPGEYVITKDFFTRNFGQVQEWLGIGYDSTTARGAVVIAKSKLDFRPYKNAGWAMHTTRVPGESGRKVSDTSARKGEPVSIWIPDEMPAFRLK